MCRYDNFPFGTKSTFKLDLDININNNSMNTAVNKIHEYNERIRTIVLERQPGGNLSQNKNKDNSGITNSISNISNINNTDNDGN